VGAELLNAFKMLIEEPVRMLAWAGTSAWGPGRSGVAVRPPCRPRPQIRPSLLEKLRRNACLELADADIRE